MKKILDADDPFFRAPWRRWVTAGLPLVWGAAEMAMGNAGWGVMFLAAGVYAAYTLIIVGPKGSE